MCPPSPRRPLCPFSRRGAMVSAPFHRGGGWGSEKWPCPGARGLWPVGGQVTVQAQGLASGAHGFPPPSVPWSSGSQTVLCQLVRNAESLAHPALLNLIRWPWAGDPLILPLRGENHCPGKFRPVVGRPQPRDPPPARPSSQPWITLLIRGGDGSTQALGWEGGARVWGNPPSVPTHPRSGPCPPLPLGTSPDLHARGQSSAPDPWVTPGWAQHRLSPPQHLSVGPRAAPFF